MNKELVLVVGVVAVAALGVGYLIYRDTKASRRQAGALNNLAGQMQTDSYIQAGESVLDYFS